MKKYAAYSLPQIIIEQKRLLKNIRSQKRKEKKGYIRSRHQMPRCYFVRWIEYKITVHSKIGKREAEPYRLITSILDPEDLSAEEAIQNYHSRWEEEVGIRELKWLQNFALPHFSAQTPERVKQELFLLLLLHSLLRLFLLETSVRYDFPVNRLSVSYINHLIQECLLKSPFSRYNSHSCITDAIFQQIYRNKLSKLSSRECPRAKKVVAGRFPSKARARGSPSFQVSYEICLQ